MRWVVLLLVGLRCVCLLIVDCGSCGGSCDALPGAPRQQGTRDEVCGLAGDRNGFM